MGRDIAAWRAERRLGWLVVVLGGLLALAVQVTAPVGVPLYDGVVVQEPYRFLHPSGGQPGSPGSYAQPRAITESVSPSLAGATTESPPQAQLIALEDAFELTAGATEIHLSITPIEAPPAPEGSSIAGNVYRFEVTDQAGTPLVPKACDGCRSLLLRAPEGTGDGVINRFVDGAWVEVETVHAGIVSLYQTNAAALGEYAVIVSGSSQPEPGLDPLVLVAVGAILIWLLVGAIYVWMRRRPMPTPGSHGPARAGRVPSKRKAPRRQPPGRSDR